MSFILKSFLPLISFIFICNTILLTEVKAVNFVNPILKTQNSDCSADNLKNERFSNELDLKSRIKICQAIDTISGKLNSVAWSPALSNELNNIWQVFSNQSVILRLMPPESTSRMLAMAEIRDSKDLYKNFAAFVFIRPDKSNDASFFQVLVHELRHVLDFYETWKNKGVVNSIELERRAFIIMSKISQETPEKENFSNLPELWKESWRQYSEAEIAARRESAVDKYLQSVKFYRELASDSNSQQLSFAYLNNISQPDYRQISGKKGAKDAERLPEQQLLPKTTSIIPQNIKDINFNLDKPKNARDANEVLRIALSNEKKLYYGMNNFSYDRRLQLQCWKKGKVETSFGDDNTITRTETGASLFQKTAYQPTQPASLPTCQADEQNLKTDFNETFWASPALEKLPISFVGFVEVDGRTLARYIVQQPSTQLFNQLADQYPAIKPFRVFVGTIFVCPEDGQIVKFWGTSFPENSITGFDSKKVWGSYVVNALRQKLDLGSGGLWVTVYIGTQAVLNNSGNIRPFSYTVKFENYRQSATDVKILDDDTAAVVNKD